MRGEVAEFDEAKGYGNIRAAQGEALFFHCTQIADGSRTIDVGTEVEFETAPGNLGRYEAVRLSPARATPKPT